MAAILNLLTIASLKTDRDWLFDKLYTNHLITGLVWYSKGRFVSNCQMVGQVFKWWSENHWKIAVNDLKCPVFKWSAKSCDFTIWKQDTYIVQYLDESGIQVSSIQMFEVAWRLRHTEYEELARISKSWHWHWRRYLWHLWPVPA